jgi:hypothetical protein
MSSGWFSIVGVLVGIFATALVSYVQTLLNNRHQLQMKALDVEAAAVSGQRADRRQSYEKFLTATDDVYQRGNDIFRDVRSGASADFRRDTRDVIGQLMRTELVLDLVGSAEVRRGMRQYVESLRTFLIKAASGEWEDSTSRARNQLLRAMVVDLDPSQRPALEKLAEPASPSGAFSEGTSDGSAS